MTNHFHAIDPQGFAHTRSSKNRTYAFTVVVLEGMDYIELQRDSVEGYAKSYGESWDRSEQQSRGVFSKGDLWRGANALANWKQGSVEFLAEHPDREAYVAEGRATGQRFYDLRVAKADWKVYGNVGWTSRLDLAHKLAAQYQGKGYQDVKILEARPGKPAKVAASKKEAA